MRTTNNRRDAHLPRTLHVYRAFAHGFLALVRRLLVQGQNDEDGCAERDGNRRPFRRRFLPPLLETSWEKYVRQLRKLESERGRSMNAADALAKDWRASSCVGSDALVGAAVFEVSACNRESSSMPCGRCCGC